MYQFRSIHLKHKHTTDPMEFAILDSTVGAENPVLEGDLVAGGVYEVDARNFSIAVWDGKEFIGIRSKFDSRFLDGEDLWRAEDGSCKPYLRVGMLPPEIRTDRDREDGPLFKYLDQLSKGEIEP